MKNTRSKLIQRTDSKGGFMSELMEKVKSFEQKNIMDESGRQIYLPLWPDSKFGVPNSFLRSALFSTTKRENCTYMKAATIFCQKGIEIQYTGMRLNQDDLRLWETIVNMVRYDALGTVRRFTTYQILKALNLSMSEVSYARVKEGIVRLIAGAVDVRHEGRFFIGSLICGVDSAEHCWEIHLNPKIIKLYEAKSYTQIDCKLIGSLGRASLTKILYRYYSSHRKPYPVMIEFLKGLSNADYKNPRDFKSKLKASLGQLMAGGFLQAFQIERKKVTVFLKNG